MSSQTPIKILATFENLITSRVLFEGRETKRTTALLLGSHIFAYLCGESTESFVILLSRMIGFSFHLLVIRLLISCVGFLANVFLIFSVVQTKLSRVKSFELFLLRLAAANLEEILTVNIYEVLIVQAAFTATNTWSCRSLKFLTMFGKITSILVTVLINVYRYQKLRDSGKRVNPQIYLDSIRSARTMSGVCVILSVLLSLPIFVKDLQGPAENDTINNVGCPPDFFHCNLNECRVIKGIYKYLFILLCNLVPLIIITVTSCLIISVLPNQRKRVTCFLSGT